MIELIPIFLNILLECYKLILEKFIIILSHQFIVPGFLAKQL